MTKVPVVFVCLKGPISFNAKKKETFFLQLDVYHLIEIGSPEQKHMVAEKHSSVKRLPL